MLSSINLKSPVASKDTADDIIWGIFLDLSKLLWSHRGMHLTVKGGVLPFRTTKHRVKLAEQPFNL